MWREHQHLQGLLLGTALLASAVAATPYAVSCVQDLGTSRAGESEPAQPDGRQATVSEPRIADVDVAAPVTP